MKKTYWSLTLLAFTVVVFFSCKLEPDNLGGITSDGIVIYSGLEILNDSYRENEPYVEIVTNRRQQLWARGPSGHPIEWISSDPLSIEVSNTGRLSVGISPNREVIISASSTIDPSVRAQVTFRTRGLR
ncbi:MAG: hypothetical protein LBC80_02065 [Treponema sp.]|jgi:hypothetical protein|nr:hypothetical protein [Treponema sp.]